MKKVLHIINSLETGGAEVLLKDSVNELITNSYPFEHFILPLFKLGNLEDQFSSEAVILSDITREKNVLLKLYKAKAFIKKHNIQVVHAHLYESCIFSRLLKKENIKVINSYHTGFHDSQSIEFSRKRLLIDKLLKSRCDSYIFVSKAVQDQIVPNLGIEAFQKIVLPNFANKRFNPIYKFNSSPSLKLIAIGNLRIQKNYSLLLNALLKLKGKSIAVDIYGEGSLKSELQDFIDMNNLPCILKGKAFITSELLKKYDAFIMTSFHEGMPISLIEVMSAGLPSVLNDIPELKETAKDGAIYFEKNSLESLSLTLDEILQNKLSLRRVASNIIKFIDDYKISNYLDTVKEQYQ